MDLYEKGTKNVSLVTDLHRTQTSFNNLLSITQRKKNTISIWLTYFLQKAHL